VKNKLCVGGGWGSVGKEEKKSEHEKGVASIALHQSIKGVNRVAQHTNPPLRPSTHPPSLPPLLPSRTFLGSVPVKVTLGAMAASEGKSCSPIFTGVCLP